MNRTNNTRCNGTKRESGGEMNRTNNTRCNGSKREKIQKVIMLHWRNSCYMSKMFDY